MFGEHRLKLGNGRSLLKQPFEFFIYSRILLPPSHIHSGQPEVLIQFLGRTFEFRQRAQLVETLTECPITIVLVRRTRIRAQMQPNRVTRCIVVNREPVGVDKEVTELQAKLTDILGLSPSFAGSVAIRSTRPMSTGFGMGSAKMALICLAMRTVANSCVP